MCVRKKRTEIKQITVWSVVFEIFVVERKKNLLFILHKHKKKELTLILLKIHFVACA